MEVYDYLCMREEIRVLGTLQINIGIFHLLLGSLWSFIKMMQFPESPMNYKTFIFNLKYPLIAAPINIISGIFAIVTERKRRLSLAKITVGINVIGIVFSLYGLITLIIEFLSYQSEVLRYSWSESSIKLLSNYLFFYTIVYVVISWIILRWNHRAMYRPSF
ncbi:membrane-spanning 4-domains subfamily A member 6C-like [Sarcophilus harrisii]|uniref:membrane-spanning 4-domains subfamily A member 6C-like n=1 Tax=Sarcophilus harrisii TaxID=9305 RepID=UPI000226EF32|nr:membrane-spanning 4-domains subfamily A member 6C-like [Sarcophilus harrisii]